MKQRCPLIIRFGKDIASLIHLRVWQATINEVNHRFCHNLFVEHNVVYIWIEGKGHFPLNFRRKPFGKWDFNISSFSNNNTVAKAKLPSKVLLFPNNVYSQLLVNKRTLLDLD